MCALVSRLVFGRMDNKTKYRAGYASIAMTVNTRQLQEQSRSVPGMMASVFLNDQTDKSWSYGIEDTDLVFSFHRPYVGRAGGMPGDVPSNPAIQTALTGLQALPSNLEMGIQEMMDNADLSEEMLNVALLASMDFHGVAMFDKSLEEASSEAVSDIAVMISGVVTTQAYEKMWVGGLVKVAMPPRAKYQNGLLYRGPGKFPGKITPILVMATPRDVTSYASTLMQEYIYNNGRRSLALLRKDANMNMFANYAVAQKEFALTCGIAFLYAMAERGFVAPPFVKNVVSGVNDMAAWRAARKRGAGVNADNVDDADATYDENMGNNFGRVFFRIDAATPTGVSERPLVALPAEQAVFHSILSGLDGDLPPPGTRMPAVLPNAPAYDRAVAHALYVATHPDYTDDRKAYKDALERFMKIVFPNSSAGAAQTMHEFGLSPHGEGRFHVARAPAVRDNPSNPIDNPYGHLLVQCKQAFQFSTIGVENLFNFNLGLCMGRCSAGANPDGTRECKFQFYLNL